MRILIQDEIDAMRETSGSKHYISMKVESDHVDDVQIKLTRSLVLMDHNLINEIETISNEDYEKVDKDCVVFVWKLEAKQIWKDDTVIGGQRESTDELYFRASYEEAYDYLGRLLRNLGSGYTFMLFPSNIVKDMDIKFTIRGKKSGKIFVVNGNEYFDEENS